MNIYGAKYIWEWALIAANKLYSFVCKEDAHKTNREEMQKKRNNLKFLQFKSNRKYFFSFFLYFFSSISFPIVDVL